MLWYGSQFDPSGIPAAQGPEMIGEPGSRQATDTNGGCIPGCPCEQLSGTVPGKNPVDRKIMQRSDAATQVGQAAIGVITEGFQGGTRQTGRPWRQGCAGIKQLGGLASQRCGTGLTVAAMTQVDAHPDSRYNPMTPLA